LSKKYIDRVRFALNQRSGYDIVRFSGQHTLRSHLAKLIEAYQIDAIIDVGANEGQFGSLVRSLGFKGYIYSFEPVSDAFNKLSSAAEEDNKWQAFNYALGAQTGETFINVSKASFFSSILDANAYAIGRWSNIETMHKQKISIKTLDECASQGLFNHNKRLFLKMDTQGYDLEVFKGARAILPHVRCMLSELSLIHIYEGMPGFAESLTAFQATGFHVSGLYPTTRNKDLTLNEVDCVLVNTARANP
jgi:FkbM family methyltransferase